MFAIYQLRVNKEKNSAFLDLNPFFYPPKAIELTAAEFRKFCSAKQSQKNQRLLLELKVSTGFDAEQVALSFLNYALSLRKEMD